MPILHPCPRQKRLAGPAGHLLSQERYASARPDPNRLFKSRAVLEALHSFYAEYEGQSGIRRAPIQALAWLDSLKPLDIASAHLFARPDVLARVCSPAFVPYFIFRDPRDVVVSHVFYVTDMEARHVHHDHYASLPGFDSRLKVSILGRPDSEAEFPDIAGRFAPYLGWLDHREVLTIHFEDLVNDHASCLNRIMDHFLARVPLQTPRESILEALESSSIRRNPHLSLWQDRRMEEIFH